MLIVLKALPGDIPLYTYFTDLYLHPKSLSNYIVIYSFTTIAQLIFLFSLALFLFFISVTVPSNPEVFLLLHFL